MPEVYNSPTFQDYRVDQLQISLDFLYDPAVTNLFVGTHRRLGKTYILVEFLFLITLDALGLINLGSEKLDALKERNRRVDREFTLTVAMPSYDQFSAVYRKSALPAAAHKYSRLYPDAEISTPLSGELMKISHQDRSIFVWPVGLNPKSIELRRGLGTDILCVDEIASVDYTLVQQVLNPMLEDTQGLTLIVGSAQAQSRSTNTKTEIAGFSKVRKHYQSTPHHLFRRITLDDSFQDDGTTPLLDKAHILESHGWTEDHPIFLQEFMVDDEIIPEQGLFRLWNRWRDPPHQLVRPQHAISVDIGFRDAYAICLYAYHEDSVNLIYYREFTGTLTDAILTDLYPVVSALTPRLDWLYLPLDSTAHHSKTSKTEAAIWQDWSLSPTPSRVFTKLHNTEPEIRRCLNVINKLRIAITDKDQLELVEERIKNSTFSLGQKELIYHDQHSHFANALMYGLLGMVKSKVLLEPDTTPPPKPKTRQELARERLWT